MIKATVKCDVCEKTIEVGVQYQFVGHEVLTCLNLGLPWQIAITPDRVDNVCSRECSQVLIQRMEVKAIHFSPDGKPEILEPIPKDQRS